MTTGLALRPYQRESIDAIHEAWQGGMRRPAVVLPTGMGKTVIFATLVDEWLADPYRPAGAVLILVHRDELATQTAEKLHMVNPDIELGIVKAERNDVGATVIIGSVQTLARVNRRIQLPRIGLVIVDECHHAAADSYLKVLDHVSALEPRDHHCECLKCQVGPALAVGFTATMGRNDNRGLGNVWQDVVYHKDISYGIEHGYLCDVRGKSITVDGLDLGEVARTRGDYQDGALGDALTECGAGAVVAEKYKELAGDRQGLLFAPTVATARSIADDFLAAGITAEVITGSTPTEERKLIYKKVASGDVQMLSNCMVLTEGFDMPPLSCVVVARPTTSQSLYVQMVGRVLRPWPGKVDALVLDVMGVSARLKLAGMVDLSERMVQPRDGESLAEAIERVERQQTDTITEPARRKLAGKIGVEDVDLFHSSASAWLRTHRGVWFIPTRQCVFFLWPDNAEAGTFKIGRTRTPYSAKGGAWLRGELSLEYAMAFAEQYAKDLDPSISQRDASWRKKKVSQDGGQFNLAVRLGIDPGEMRQGALSDAISIHYASNMLDRGKGGS